MIDIKASAVSRAVALLNAAGAQYKIIYGDQEFGELVVAPVKVRKSKEYPRGERTEYIKLHISGMKPGEVVEIPYGPYPKEDLAPIVPPACHDMWGNGQYVTNSTDTGVTVLRV